MTSRAGLWIGLICGLGTIFSANALAEPLALTPQAVRTLGVTFIVGIWWITEALPLGATALVPAAAFPLLDIVPAKVLAPSYMSSFIQLLLGGFLLALMIERSGVHRRIALSILLRVGTSPHRLILGFGLTAAVMSMWISNTATTLIMMPVVIAICDRAQKSDAAAAQLFTLGALLATGYCASVGGMGTPIGTPPNVIAQGALASVAQTEVNFLDWAMYSFPVVVLAVPAIWFLLTRVLVKVPAQIDLGAAQVIESELVGLGRMRSVERRALAVFGLAALLWVTRSGFDMGDLGSVPGWAALFGLGKSPDDGTVAMLVSVIAFAVPSGAPDKARLLPWATAKNAPWDLVLLFGGGIALAKGFTATGLSADLSERLATFADWGIGPFVAVASLSATFGTEIISNTALANIAMPILAETALRVGMDPRALILPCAWACSCAFMMPAATGPNAIVFGTGRVRIAQMVRVGLFVNLVVWALLISVSWLLFA